MDPSWTAPLWQLIMIAVLGLGAGTVAFIGWQISQRPKLPRDLERSRLDLEIDVRGVVNACVTLSEAVRVLVVRIKQLPPEYRPAAEHALKLAAVIEEATYAEGVRHGIFPRPLFTAGNGPPPPTAPPRPLIVAPTNDERPSAEIIQLPAASSREWIHGQLLPAVGVPNGAARVAVG